MQEKTGQALGAIKDAAGGLGELAADAFRPENIPAPFSNHGPVGRCRSQGLALPWGCSVGSQVVPPCLPACPPGRPAAPSCSVQCSRKH